MESKQEMKIKMQRYFDAVEFIKWDDITAPIIQFSNDASLAYVTMQKEVIIKDKSGVQPDKKDTTIYAWVSIYQKFGNDWQLVSNIPTNK